LSEKKGVKTGVRGILSHHLGLHVANDRKSSSCWFRQKKELLSLGWKSGVLWFEDCLIRALKMSPGSSFSPAFGSALLHSGFIFGLYVLARWQPETQFYIIPSSNPKKGELRPYSI